MFTHPVNAPNRKVAEGIAIGMVPVAYHPDVPIGNKCSYILSESSEYDPDKVVFGQVLEYPEAPERRREIRLK